MVRRQAKKDGLNFRLSQWFDIGLKSSLKVYAYLYKAFVFFLFTLSFLENYKKASTIFYCNKGFSNNCLVD